MGANQRVTLPGYRLGKLADLDASVFENGGSHELSPVRSTNWAAF